MRGKGVRAVVSSFMLVTVAFSSSLAQTQRQALDYWSNIVEFQIPRILDRMWPNMTQREREIASEVQFDVVRDHLTNAVAYTRNGEPHIEIHAGLIRAAEFMSQARAYALATNDPSVLGDYLNYVADEIYNTFGSGAAPTSVAEIDSFATFTGMGPAEWEQFRNQPVVDQAMEMEMNSALMWLIGHELGHHFHGHRSGGSLDAQRAQEEEADQVARRLMRGTEYNPAFAMPILLVFAVWEPEAHHRETCRTHPAPLTRIERNLRAGVDELLSDPGFVQHLRESGQEATFQRQVDRDLEAIRRLWIEGPQNNPCA